MSYIQRRRIHFFLVCFTVLFFISVKGISQYYLIGTDPSAVRWNQIKTPHFSVICPRTLESKGQYIANALEYVYRSGSRSLYDFTPRTPVIIHNQTTVPSSVTYIAPRRMEFFITPPQDIYPQDWVDQLIIHEFRHAVGYSAVNCGFTKAINYVLGEQGVFGIFGLFLPMWFIEGDPTMAETALHYTGRGRSPSFEMRLRAQFLQKGIFPYEKANYGSYRDFVPGKYELGYQLVGWARADFGPRVWSKVINNVGKRPYTLVPFSAGIRKQTGFNKFQLYDTLTRQIRQNWINSDKNIEENEYDLLTICPVNQYTNYNLPVILKHGQILAVKSSIDDLSRVVLIDDNKNERPLFITAVGYYNESLAAYDSLIYWSELVHDPRWLLRDYRVIKSFNIKTGKIRQITHQTRYYSPSVTDDGKFLVTVEVTPENNYFLTVIESETGNVVKKFTTPDNLLFVHPHWSADGKTIVSVVVGKAGNTIAMTDTETGRTGTVLPVSFMEIKRPSFYSHYIIYTASYNGTDNIYAVDRSTKEIFRVTSSRFGASDATVSDGSSSIIYSDYSADGYRIVREKLDTASWQKVTVPLKSAFPLAEILTMQEKFIFDTDSVPETINESKPYRKIPHLFHLHSWAPLGLDVQNISATPGATLLSQNLLGTTVSSLGYMYNRNERAGKYFLRISDESLYTAFDFSADYAGRKDIGIYTDNETITEKWKELNLSLGLRLPLYWTHNAWTRRLQPAMGIKYKFLKMNESVPLEFEHDKIITLDYSFFVSNTLKTSHRDINPRWSQQLQVNYSNTPFKGGDNSVFACQITTDVPGFFRHHGLRLYGAYQKTVEDYYPFSDYIVFPRGYTEINRNEIYSFSAMYTMPLFYPEWRVDHLLYFKRFKSGFFYDFARSSDNIKPRSFTSIGLDLTSDFSLFSLIAPLDAGIRSIYHPDTCEMQFELLFALNFGAMY